MGARELANEIGDLVRVATAFEEANRYSDAITAYDLATQLLAEFTSEVDRKLVAAYELFEGTDEPPK